MKRVTIGLGGNAILDPTSGGSYRDQLNNVKETAEYIAESVAKGYEFILAHGNGPQVGNLMIQQELGKQEDVPPKPLDACVAMTQSLIGYMLQQGLTEKLKEKGIEKSPVTLVTRVLVDENDEAFENPRKPVGPFYSKEKKEEIEREHSDYVIKKIKENSDKPYRRVVPSPEPKEIVERDSIKQLLSDDSIVIAGGGGGIPVIEKEHGYEGIEAVIDKDRTAEILASATDSDILVLLTNVPYAYKNFRKEDQRKIEEMSVKKAKELYDQGEFPPGSMGPKIEAAIEFCESNGGKSIITEPKNLVKALEEGKGTLIYQE